MRNILINFIQPLRGCKISFVHSPTFHVGLSRLNPFRIYNKIDSDDILESGRDGATGEETSLGLSLSYDIITKGHGGKLIVESEPGNGSIFKVVLPPCVNMYRLQS